LRKIADEAESVEGIVNIVDDLTDAGLDTFESAARRYGGDPKARAFLTNDGSVYLRRSSGKDILVDFAHEMTHRIDHKEGAGIFKKIGSDWYSKSLDVLDEKQLFRSEFRAYRVGNIVANHIDGSPRFATRKELFDQILSIYTNARNPY